MLREVVPWVLWLLSVLRIAVVPLVGIFLILFAYKNRDARCLWLLLPGVIAPVVGWFAVSWQVYGINRLVNGQPVGAFPFTLVEQKIITAGSLSNAFFEVSYIAGSLSLLLASYMIYRTSRASHKRPSSSE